MNARNQADGFRIDEIARKTSATGAVYDGTITIDPLTFVEPLSEEETRAIEDGRPFPNEHAARLRNPGDFVSASFRRVNDGTIFGTKKVPATVAVIWGKLKGAAKPSDNPHPQSLRFPTKNWTAAQAKKWLKDNSVKTVSFEAASGEKSDGEIDEETRSKIVEEVHVREFRFTHKKVNNEDRTVEVAFSSETGVERFFGLEILDHDPSSVRLSRLNNKAALLLEHDRDKQIGVVEIAHVDPDKVGRAMLRFSRSDLAEEILKDVDDGIRTKVSMNYRIHDIHLESKEGDKQTFRSTDWEPLEISIVSVAADDSVGVDRSEETRKTKHEQSTGGGTTMGNPQSTEVNVEEIRREEREAERERVSNIDAVAQTFTDRVSGMAELRNEAVAKGMNVDDFNHQILERMSKVPPVETSDDDGTSTAIGMNAKDLERYSLVRAIRQIGLYGKLDGIEREASEAAEKQYKRVKPLGMTGFIIPHDVQLGKKRALSVTDATKGGYLVGTEVMGASMIELLRNKMVVAAMGARALAGLVGNVAIPKVSGGAVASWLPETGSAPATDQTFGQVVLTPHRLVGDTAYSKELMMQASIDVESFVRDDIMQVLAIAKDLAAINGSGNAGQPTGILNVTGTNSVTFGAAPTWAKVVEFETEVGKKNAARGALAYLTDATVRGKWKTTVKVTNQAVFLWDTPANTVNGFPAFSTEQVPSNLVIFGNFNDLILADWAGIDVVVDPFSLKKTGQIEITVTLHTDIAVRHAESFTISTDSGAQ